VSAAILVLFAPLLSEYPRLVIPSPYPDALEFIWTTWRMQGVLDGTKELYWTKEVFAPEGASLLLHTVCEGLLLPITLLFGSLDPIWRFNAAIIVTFLLNGIAAISLFRTLGTTPLVGCLGALLVVCAPFQIGHLIAGHLNFLVLFPLLELCTVFIACLRGDDCYFSRRMYMLRGALALFLLGRTNLYYLYFAALVIVVLSAHGILKGGLCRRRIAAVWVGCAVGLACNVMHLYEVASLALSRRYTPDHNPLTASADLVAYIVPSSLQLLGTLPLIRELRSGVVFHEGETSLYFGLVLLVTIPWVALSGIAQKKRDVLYFLILSFVALLLSLGPRISVGGRASAPNPLDIVARTLLPLYPSVPARFGLLANLFLIVALVQGMGRRVSVLLIVPLGIVALLEKFPTPYPLVEISVGSAAIERLRDDTSVDVVLDSPVIVQRAMLRQTVHGKALLGGFLSRRPRKREREIRSNRFVQMVAGSPRTYSLAELRDGWCLLRADALLLEAPRDTQLLHELANIGLHKVDGDTALSVFKPSQELCQNT